MPKLLTVGHTTLDNFVRLGEADLHCDVDNKNCKVCFNFGSKIPVESVGEGVGGGAANVAVGTQKLEVETRIYTIIGSDAKSASVIEGLKSAGIGLEYLKQDSSHTDQSVVLSFNEERTIFTYASPRKYSIDVVRTAYEWGAKALFVSSIGSGVEAFFDDLKRFKEEHPDLVLFYNPGSRELKDSLDAIVSLVPSVDYLIANVEESCRIVNPGLNREQIEIKDLADMLLDKGIKNVVITDSINGAYIATPSEYFHEPAELVKVAEKTGAGDAFSSGFISAVLHGMGLRTAARWGIVNSSSAIQVFGAQNGLLSKKEIANII